MKKILAIILTTLVLCVVVAHPGWAASNNVPVVSGADALTKLLDGNQRYEQGHPELPSQSVERRTDLANGQHPFASVLGCSDSRVPPELVFDQGLGDLFVVRLAGNVADQVAIESIDYSVTHLGVRLVMVLGHDKCGAVTAAVLGHEEPGDVGPMLRELSPAVAATRKMPGNRIDNAIRENVILTVRKLSTSKELRGMVKSGDLKIVGGIYSLASGKVEILNTTTVPSAAKSKSK
ncbi:MAG: carbonic anhydrase [Candidatus Binataceae bacterium]